MPCEVSNLQTNELSVQDLSKPVSHDPACVLFHSYCHYAVAAKPPLIGSIVFAVGALLAHASFATESISSEVCGAPPFRSFAVLGAWAELVAA
jgi:hypothetical protein